MADSVASGLEGVVVADTVLSEVDGERGRLVIAGHEVEELGGRRITEPMEIPEVGRFAVVADPWGAVFQVIT